MLKDSLYTVLAIDHSDNTIHAVLEVDQHNEIFKGHFPDHPVLPGACILQMVKEVFEQAMGNPYRLEKAENLKFLTVVDPQTVNSLHLEINYVIEEAAARVNASLTTDEGVAFKLQGVFIAERH
jgi:3-hydroxyacyl-[acyl-carrier-protein] dehydratase